MCGSLLLEHNAVLRYYLSLTNAHTHSHRASPESSVDQQGTEREREMGLVRKSHTRLIKQQCLYYSMASGSKSESDTLQSS